ncbi:MAG: HDOD domain-containing protein [Phycisphaeraceae bacterium]
MSETTPATNTSAETEAIVTAAIQEISHIATLPEVTMKIIKLVEDPDSTAQDLNNVISNDPALGARILKVVNSAFYGLPGQIGSINRAIVLLGLNAVKNIAIAASLAKLFRGGKIAANFDARDLWQNAIASACATRLLAEKVQLGLPDEAFLSGLIHDIGIMVEIQARRNQFVEILQKLDEDPMKTLRQAEIEVLGATHEQFGQGLCKLWKFPQSFQYVTGFHHRPTELAEGQRTLTGLVYVADVITKQLEIGFTAGTESNEVDPALLKELGLTEGHLKEVAEQLPEAIEEASGIFQMGG